MSVEGVPPPHVASILQTPQALRAQARERRRARPVGGSGATDPPDEDADAIDAPAAAEAVHNDLGSGPHAPPYGPTGRGDPAPDDRSDAATPHLDVVA